MASGESSVYQCPAVQRPTVEQLQSLALTAHLHISTDDLQQYKASISHLLGVYDQVDKLTEPTLVSKYMTTAGCQPTPSQNPYNAWARLTDIVGSGTGKLAGKNLAIKDSIHVAGVPLANGSKFMDGFVSSYSATVVNRILDQGGCIKGKATCENMCFSGNSFTAASGPVLNPYDKAYSAGGSTNGAAVLVAIGEVDMAVGGDSGGSIRLPSCQCGIVGLKPTLGLVPSTGALPYDANLDCLGPMARTVKDCALLLEVIAGYDNGLAPTQSSTLSVPNYTQQLTGDVNGLRVGVLKEGFDGCEADVAETVRNAVNSLKQLGVTVDEFSSTLHSDAVAIATLLLIEGFYDTYRNGGLNPLNSGGFKDTMTHDFLFNASRSAADRLPASVKTDLLLVSYIRENYGCHFYSKAINVLREVTAGYDELFKQYDVIVMPTCKFKARKLPAPGITIQEYMQHALGNSSNTIAYNATGHPALTINAGFSNTQPCLPIGIQFIGQRHDDVTVLRLAHAYERLRDSSPVYKQVEKNLPFKVRNND